MVFKKMKPNSKPGEDCRDFKPNFFNRRHCKLFYKCANGWTFMERDKTSGYCDGIEWWNWGK